MSRVLHKHNPYDPSIARKFPIHHHLLYSASDDHGQCAGCFEEKGHSAKFYECPECDIFFHKECIESAPEITHPSHPQHSLYLDKRESLPDTNRDRKCCLCGEDLMLLVYRCLICDFKLDLSCAKNPPLLEVDQDQHKLHLLKKKVSFTCDACGLEGDRSPYLCLPCNSMFHVRCVNFGHGSPRICSILPGIWYCGCGSVHSDVVECGKIKELEEKLNDGDDDDDDVVIGPVCTDVNTIILHFTHDHRLKFHKDGRVDDVNARCNMCKLSVASTPHYACIVCSFFLHQRCTELPWRKRSILHDHHQLCLEGSNSTPDLEFHQNYFCCNACGHFNDGIKYTCHPGFNLDIGCASITLPFKFDIHPHTLTFVSTSKRKCGVCELWASPVLSCGECDFFLGFDCAQLPVLASHKYDKHALRLTGDVTRRDDYWCEICEKKVDGNAIFYTCDDSSCCSTFHTHCVIGGLNLDLHFCFMLFGRQYVVDDNTFAAPRHCCICGLGCKGPKVIKINQGGHADKYLCSSSCLMRNRYLLQNV
ncbi:hypothetical protein YC2023_102381 [Brassica napus]|uniref:uncharacterized protein LOC106309144 n=1 Tax=Brassica oleracea var. oleracea TaxID=109376 RepID=UPI0006A6CB33|nr:PREDICTED: uncharacterized protein LOC106309144 [Brassica oleracea var. oleracea]